MKVLHDKDFTAADRERIAAREKARTCNHMLSVGRRRMKEIENEHKLKLQRNNAGVLNV